MPVAVARVSPSVVQRERLFGLETEYTYAAISPSGQRQPGHETLYELLQTVREQNASLPDRRSAGMFLANGSRLYPDCGHPELATPECRTPTDLVRYVLAGDQILSAAAREVSGPKKKAREIFLARSNVSYGAWPATWGCHESYGHTASMTLVQAGILPHLVSRVIYTGAGGFNNRSPGLEFLLSPRVEYLARPTSDRSTADRGIFHSKIEPLNSSGYHRLHVICGEGLCSQTGMWLKAATTALVLALIDAGFRPGRNVRLKNPNAAMRAFASDPTCRATAEAHESSEPLTAIEIQRRYLELAELHAEDSFMPEWTRETCVRWREMLDRLAAGPANVSRTLDWAIKLAMFRRHARKAGFEWDELARWTAVIEQVRDACNARSVADSADAPEISAKLLDPANRYHAILMSFMPNFAAEGLDFALLRKFFALRDDLWALDSRYSQIGTGVFASLDRAGVLDHHIEGVDRIDDAVANPPDFGRAHLRGTAIRRLATNGHRMGVDWNGIWDFTDRRLLDLDNPFAAFETWAEIPPEDPDGVNYSIESIVSENLSRILALYDSGHYEEGHLLIRQTARYAPLVNMTMRQYIHRYDGWFQSRRGFLDGNAALRAAYGENPASLSSIADVICARRYQGLRPPVSIDDLFQQADARMARDPGVDPLSAATIDSHRAYHQLRRGKPRAAYRLFREVCEPPRVSQVHSHVRSRILSDLADCCRALGWRKKAAALLDEAERIQIAERFEGDRADHTLTYRAKLAETPQEALRYLDEALEIQRRLGNRMGEARTRFLQARITSDAKLKAQCRRRLLTLRRILPALADCDLTEILFRRWKEWTSGAQPAHCRDPFWWL